MIVNILLFVRQSTTRAYHITRPSPTNAFVTNITQVDGVIFIL